MKLIILTLLFLHLSFSQGLNYFKSNKVNSILVFSKSQVSQSTATFISDFAAGLSFINTEKAVTFSYKKISANESLNTLNLGIFYKLTENHRVGFAYNVFKVDRYKINTVSNTDLILNDLSESALNFSYAYNGYKQLKLGVNAVYVTSEIVPSTFIYDGNRLNSIQSLNLNLSAIYLLNNAYSSSLFASINNLGSDQKYTKNSANIEQPLYFQLGAYSVLSHFDTNFIYGSLNSKKTTNSGLQIETYLGLDLNKKMDVHIGYSVDNKFLLGASYLIQNTKLTMEYTKFSKNTTDLGIASQLEFTIQYAFVEDLEEVYEQEDFTLIDEDTVPKVEVEVDTVTTIPLDTAIIVKIEKGSPLILDGVNFKMGSSKITEKSFNVLGQIYMTLTKYNDLDLIVTGHTDNTGNEDQNIKLSLNRANSIKQYFVDKGIDSLRISTNGLGSSSPIDTNDTKEGRQKNRRIEFKKREKAIKEKAQN